MAKLIRVILDYITAWGFRAFCAFLVVTGLSTLALDWLDLLYVFLGLEDETALWEQILSKIAGVVVAATGIALAVNDHRKTKQSDRDEANRRREAKEKYRRDEAARQERKAADELIAALQRVVTVYRQAPQLNKTDLFGVPERLDAQQKAKKFHKLHTGNITQDATFASVLNVSMIAGSDDPYLGKSVADLQELISKLEQAYETK